MQKAYLDFDYDYDMQISFKSLKFICQLGDHEQSHLFRRSLTTIQCCHQQQCEAALRSKFPHRSSQSSILVILYHATPSFELWRRFPVWNVIFKCWGFFFFFFFSRRKHGVMIIMMWFQNEIPTPCPTYFMKEDSLILFHATSFKVKEKQINKSCWIEICHWQRIVVSVSTTRQLLWMKA